MLLLVHPQKSYERYHSDDDHCRRLKVMRRERRWRRRAGEKR
jgi:hypothetical protein